LDFTVVFNEAVVVTGTPYMNVTVGSNTRQAAYVSGSGGTSITFRYAVQSGEIDADGIAVASPLVAGGATVRDAASNNATLSFTAPSLSSVLVDSAAPSVSAISLAGSSPTNAASLGYTVAFSEGVTGVDVSDFTLTASGTASGNIASISGSGSSYAVTVNSVTGTGNLRLDLNSSGTGIADSAGNAISAGYSAGSVYAVDRDSPAAPSALSLDAASDSGSSNSDRITKNTALGISGSAETGSTVNLYDSSTLVGTGTASGGTFSITSSDLAEGTHSLTATSTDAVGNTSSASSALSVTVYTSNPSITSAATASGTYGSAASYNTTANRTCTYGATSLPTGLSIDAASGAISGTATAAGVFDVTLTATDQAGNSNTKALTYTIAKAVLTVTAADKTRPYGDANPLLTTTVTGYVNGDNASVITGSAVPSCAATATTAVGTASITVDVSGLSATNYSFAGASGTLSITKAPLAVTADDKSRYYGYADPTFSATITGFKNSETSVVLGGSLSFSTDAVAASPVGSYTITVTQGSLSSSNYSFSSFTNGTLGVTKAPLTVTADDASRAYGSDNPAFTATITGFKNSETASVLGGSASVSTTATKTSAVGTYPLTPSVGTLAADNYSFVNFTNGTLTVTKPVITVTAADKSKTYGTANPEFTYSYSGFVDGDNEGSAMAGTPTISSVATSTSNAGTYPIALALGSLASTNYTFSLVNGTLTVNKAALSVTAADKSRIYGQSNPSFTYSMSGFVGSDTEVAVVTGSPALACAANAASSVGGYDITVDVSALSATNYSFSGVTGTLTITKATPVITWNDPSGITYGTALSATQLNASADTAGAFVYSPASGSVLNAGVRALDVSFTPTDTANWTSPVTKSVSLTVGKATPSITWAAPSAITYGTALSATQLNASASTAGVFTYTPVSGTVLGAGIQNLGVSFAPTDTGNWTTPVTKTVSLTVNKAVLTVTAADKTRLYGDANPLLTTTVAGYVNGDTYSVIGGSASLACAATATTAVGTAPITVDVSGMSATNYSFTGVGGTLSITRAPLTVTAANKSRYYGYADPVFTATVSGFKNSETSAVLSGSAGLSTAAVAGSPVGSYAITVTQGSLSSSNYSFSSFVDGTLSVTKAPLTVTASNKARSYGSDNPSLTATIGGFVNGETDSVVSGSASLSTTAAKTSPVGTYPISVSLGTLVADNYAFTSFVEGVFTVGTPVLTVTANSLSKYYGDANPTLTYRFSGFANDETEASAVNGAPIVATTATTDSGVGTYPITLALGSLSATNYTLHLDNGVLTVNKATLTVSADDKTRLYGQANPELTLKMSGFVNGETSTALTSQPSASTSATLLSPVGGYTISPSGASSANYDFYYIDGVLSITQASASVSLGSLSHVYDGSSKAASASTSPAGLDLQILYGGSSTAPTRAGVYSVVASVTDPNYSGSASGTLVIGKAATNVVWSDPQAIVYGTPLGVSQLNASCSIGGSFSYSPAGNSYLGAGIHTLGVTFTPGDPDNYFGSTGSVQLTVNKAVLTVTANDKARNYGEDNPALTYSISGFVHGDDSSVVSGTPALNTSATTQSSAGAYVIAAAAGSLSAANYSFVFNSGTLTVGKVMPVLTWTEPAAISYGTPLGAVQLSASASVPGTISYTPGPGTVLPAGTATLSAMFTPTDGTSYTTATKAVSLTVRKAAQSISFGALQDAKSNEGPFSLSAQAGSGLPVAFSLVSGPATLSGSVLSLTGTAGTVVVRASQSGDGNFEAASSVDRSFSVTLAKPTMTITSPLTATASVGRQFLYRITTNIAASTFSASGLPSGLTMDSSSGHISGIPLKDGAFSVLLGASNGEGSDAKTLLLTISPSLPSITSAASANGQIGKDFVYAIVAGNSPTSYGASGLPSGLSLNSATGLISGKPAAAGSWTVVISATNAAGTSSMELQIMVSQPAQAPAYLGVASLSGTQGTSFSYLLAFSNTPTSLTLMGSQSLPAGLSFNSSTGLISGTPTVAGTFVISIKAANDSGSVLAQVTLTINPSLGAPSITSVSAANLTSGTAFAFQLTAEPSATSFGATGLPSGLSLAPATGLITGTSSDIGTHDVLVRAANASGFGPESRLVITVLPAASAPVITSSPYAEGTVGSVFGFQLAATGENETYALISGGLPPGLILNPSTGLLSGVPTQLGEWHAMLAASSSGNQGPVLDMLIVIKPRAEVPVITCNGSAVARVGEQFLFVVTATNSPVSFQISELPSGLSADLSKGTISGIASAARKDAYEITLVASNSAGRSQPKTLSLTVEAGQSTPVITSATSASTRVGESFSYSITATENATAYMAESLPDGLEINTTTGLISGTATRAGTYSVLIKAANAAGVGDGSVLTLYVAPALAAPRITSAAFAVGTSGSAFTYAATAEPEPILSYELNGTLPSGLSFNSSTGLISGKPSQPGFSVVTLLAYGAGGRSMAQEISITIKAAASLPVITSPIVASGRVGADFSYQISASNMPTTSPLPSSCSLDAGGLPRGLAVNSSTGEILGVPLEEGQTNVALFASNEAGQGPVRVLNINILPAERAPVVTSENRVFGRVGQSFHYAITASDSPTSFAATGAPSWMTIDSVSGLLAGLPDVPGNFTIQVLARNASGFGTPVPVMVTILPVSGTLVITSSRTAFGRVGSKFAYQIVTSTPASSYSATGLPAGLVFNSDAGLISGTALVSGKFTLTLCANSQDGRQSLPIELVIIIQPTRKLIVP
jgi:hypothetical protein